MTFKTFFGQILDQPRGTDGRFQPVREDKPLKTVFGVIVEEQDDEDDEDEKDEDEE